MRKRKRSRQIVTPKHADYFVLPRNALQHVCFNYYTVHCILYGWNERKQHNPPYTIKIIKDYTNDYVPWCECMQLNLEDMLILEEYYENKDRRPKKVPVT